MILSSSIFFNRKMIDSQSLFTKYLYNYFLNERYFYKISHDLMYDTTRCILVLLSSNPGLWKSRSTIEISPIVLTPIEISRFQILLEVTLHKSPNFKAWLLKRLYVYRYINILYLEKYIYLGMAMAPFHTVIYEYSCLKRKWECPFLF